MGKRCRIAVARGGARERALRSSPHAGGCLQARARRQA